MMDIADISISGLKYRLNQSVPFLAAIMGRLLTVQAASQGLRGHGRTPRMADGTCIKKGRRRHDPCGGGGHGRAGPRRLRS